MRGTRGPRNCDHRATGSIIGIVQQRSQTPYRAGGKEIRNPQLNPCFAIDRSQYLDRSQRVSAKISK